MNKRAGASTFPNYEEKHQHLYNPDITLYCLLLRNLRGQDQDNTIVALAVYQFMLSLYLIIIHCIKGERSTCGPILPSSPGSPIAPGSPSLPVGPGGPIGPPGP